MDKLCRDFPGKSRAAIERAVNVCKETIQLPPGERGSSIAREGTSLTEPARHS